MTAIEDGRTMTGTRLTGAPVPGAYLIGELAALVGLEGKTVRFYERAGLIEPQRIGRLRLFTNHDVERLRSIKALRECDLPIKCIKALLQDRSHIDFADPPPEVKAAVEAGVRKQREKLDQVESRFKDWLKEPESDKQACGTCEVVPEDCPEVLKR